MASIRNETTTLSAGAMKQALQGEDSNKQHRGPLRIASVATIRWLESLRVPKALERGNPGPEGIPVISGLERVFFGTQPACEVVKILGFAPPRYLCYMVSGFLCDLIQFVIDLILHKVFLLQDASLCWALGFGASVAFRHTSHRYLVFGDYVGGYWRSLSRMYAGYSIIIVLSTIFNFIMTHHMHLPHYVAWIVTMLWTGIVNYFILKKLWSFGGKEKEDGEGPQEGKTAEDLEMSTPEPDLEMQGRSDRKLQARKTDKR
jgi:putative flippase GtrA